ncbi:MAG: hypothetical protein WCF66_14630 [Pseudolabrys sp.]
MAAQIQPYAPQISVALLKRQVAPGEHNDPQSAAAFKAQWLGRALTKYRHIATIFRTDDVTSMHHIRFFRSYVMASTTESDWLPYFTGG